MEFVDDLISFYTKNINCLFSTKTKTTTYELYL
jgi:hypothetical protein